MVDRNEYLDRLISWKHEKVIKVVTGIRRCGKSTLLHQFMKYLKSNGVLDEQIISLNFEELENESLLDRDALYSYLKDRLCKDKYTYIFLDEIQNVSEYERIVDSLYVKENTDIYITGSNSYLLSSELATFLSGRYIEIPMLPLSFSEFHKLCGGDSAEKSFNDFLAVGGMPYIAVMERTKEKVDAYLEGIYNTIIVKDIEERQRRKEAEPSGRKASDLTLLKGISKYLASVIGSPVSVKGIADYLSSNGRKISSNTVNEYINALIESFVFYSAERFDIQGKLLLKTNRKLYMVDLGLRRHLLAKKEYDLGFSIENIVFFELLRRGYKVNIGKVGATEIDFVARRGDKIEYYQVTASLLDERTFEREKKPLESIKDNYPKKILTLDQFTLGNYNGIVVENLIEWLLIK